MKPWALALLLQVVAVTVHEAGHVAAAKCCGLRLAGVWLGKWGSPYVRLAGTANARQRAAIALGGPLGSVVGGLGVWLTFGTPLIGAFVAALGVVQLLPFPHSDGRKAWKALTQ